MTGRVLALDIGTRRIGVARSDETRTIATPCATIEFPAGTDPLPLLGPLVAAPDVTEVVIGLPVDMTGRRTEAALRVEELARRVEAEFGKPVALIDERLTTTLAQRLMHEHGQRPSRNRPAVDRLAAVLILETYLERTRPPG